jgi:hypothetical protein
MRAEGNARRASNRETSIGPRESICNVMKELRKGPGRGRALVLLSCGRADATRPGLFQTSVRTPDHTARVFEGPDLKQHRPFPTSTMFGLARTVAKRPLGCITATATRSLATPARALHIPRPSKPCASRFNNALRSFSQLSNWTQSSARRAFSSSRASRQAQASAEAPLPKLSPPSVGRWLLISSGLVFAVVVVGGVTRLTESGLSITEWKPITGVVPPMSQAAWEEEFEKYKATPEFKMYVLSPSFQSHLIWFGMQYEPLYHH